MALRSGVRLSVSAAALLLFAAAYYFDALGLLALIFIAAAAHELGHYAAVRLCGGRVAEIRLGAIGVVMRAELCAGYEKELLIAAAGPAASAVFAAACACAARVLELESAYRLAGMSVVFCVFNLLPVFPLDGARMLYALAARFVSLGAAERISCISGCVVIFLTFCAGAYVLYVTGTNLSLLAAAAWMLIYYCKNGNSSVI